MKHLLISIVAIAIFGNINPAFSNNEPTPHSDNTASTSGINNLLCADDSCRAHIMMLHRQARGGDLTALSVLAMLYLTGDGVEKDEQQGLNYMKIAARHEEPIALNALATWYRHGQWVPQDMLKANEYLIKAVAKGYAPAQYQMALQTYRDNVDNNPEQNKEATELLTLAAQSGSAPAMFLLARLKINGELVPYDLEGAAALLRRLSINGHDEARALSRQLASQLQQQANQIAATETDSTNPEQANRYANLAASLEGALNMERIQVTGTHWGRSDSAIAGITFQRDAYFNRGSMFRIRGQECDFATNCASVRPDSRSADLFDVLNNNIN